MTTKFSEHHLSMIKPIEQQTFKHIAKQTQSELQFSLCTLPLSVSLFLLFIDVHNIIAVKSDVLRAIKDLELCTQLNQIQAICNQVRLFTFAWK